MSTLKIHFFHQQFENGTNQIVLSQLLKLLCYLKKRLLEFIRPKAIVFFNIHYPMSIKHLTRLRIGFSHLKERKSVMEENIPGYCSVYVCFIPRVFFSFCNSQIYLIFHIILHHDLFNFEIGSTKLRAYVVTCHACSRAIRAHAWSRAMHAHMLSCQSALRA